MSKEQALSALDDLTQFSGKTRTGRPANVVSSPELCLLTHLSPRELVLFLASTDSERQQQLTLNPPSLEQQQNAICAKERRLWRKWVQLVRQPGLCWAGVFSDPGQVSVLSMQQWKAQREKHPAGSALMAQKKNERTVGG